MKHEQKAPTSCNGCNQSVYSARYGQPRNPSPHSRCGALNRDIPMTITPREERWIASDIPQDCPQRPRANHGHAQ